MSTRMKASLITPKGVDATPRNFEQNRVGMQAVYGGYSERLAKVIRSVPASAMAGAQWATRYESSSTYNDPTESLGLRRTSSSSGGSSTSLLPKGAPLFSTSSPSDIHCDRLGISTSLATPNYAIKATQPFSSFSVSRGGPSTSTSSSVGRGQDRLFTPPMAPPSRRSLTSSTTPQRKRTTTNTSIFSIGSHKFQNSFSDSSSISNNRNRNAKNKSDPISAPNRQDTLDIDHDILQEDDVRSHDQSSIEESSQVVMSLSWGQGRLGAAFYDVITSQVYVVEDKIEAAPDFWVLKTLFREQKPRWALLGGRQDERFFGVLRELCGVPNTPLTAPTSRQQDQSGKENTSSLDASSSSPTASSSAVGSCIIRVLPMSDYKYELCLRRVLSLVLPGEPEGVTEDERELFVRGRVNTDLIQMTKALGALLRFIDKHGMDILSPTNLVDGSSILGLHVYTMEELAQLDEVTACALQLFSEDQHPAASKSGKSSASKEGLSVYALLSRTSCPMTSHTLRRVLLRPVVDIDVLEARYALIGWGVEAVNLETVRNLQTSMKKITNVPHVMNRLNRGQLSVRDWKVLYNSLFNAILVGELCQGQDQDIPIFKETGSCVTEGLYHASFLIQRILDMEQSEREARFVVKPGVDNELDEKKRRFSGLGDVMRRVAEMELARLPPEVESCSIIYLPHVGYLLAIPPTSVLDQSLPANDYNLPGLEFMFRTADLILYKSFTCCEMDRELGDIQVEIANHETRIMMRLVEALLQQAQTFTALVDNILMLDCLLAFAVVSREFGWVKPELTDDPILEVVEARHPLYELCTPTFVANPIRSGSHNPRVTLITGPNASGKTVYLKQVGVLVVLAQIGCWVPASQARLKPMDAIITVTQATPPVTSSLSAFMLDLSRMCNALSRATKYSLVIIDEFGAATYENDGAALLTACLDYWCQRAVPRYTTPPSQDKLSPYAAPPHVFVSTHLLQVYDHLQYQDAVRCLALEAVEEEGNVIPLYQVTEGRANKSYAASVAALAGIPQHVVDRAIQVCECIRRGSLPPRWSLLNDNQERSRCEAVVSLLLSYDLTSDPLDVLLTKIRSYGHDRPGSVTPASRTPSETSVLTATQKTPGTSTLQETSSINSSISSQSKMNNVPDVPRSTRSTTHKVTKSSRSSEKLIDNMISSSEDLEASNYSNSPLNYQVETIFSTETSPVSRRDSTVKRYVSHRQRMRETNSEISTSSSFDRKRKTVTASTSPPKTSVPFTSTETLKTPPRVSQKPFSDASTVLFHKRKNMKTTSQRENQRRQDSRSSILVADEGASKESCHLSSQDHESASEYSCSQESVVLQRKWTVKSVTGQTNTQGFQPSSPMM